MNEAIANQRMASREEIISMEIKEHAVYTHQEVQILLKVSPSTLTRMIKSGTLRSAKVGRQHRIMGKELLRILLPAVQ